MDSTFNCIVVLNHSRENKPCDSYMIVLAPMTFYRGAVSMSSIFGWTQFLVRKIKISGFNQQHFAIFTLHSMSTKQKQLIITKYKQISDFIHLGVNNVGVPE